MTTTYSPIIIVGAARSGTHLLASTLASMLECTYIGDANHIWRNIPAAPAHDAFHESLATDRAIRAIRNRFECICKKHGNSLLIEKTAANAMRMPFVYRVFPNAKYLYIVRDGRDVAVSVRKKMQGDHRKQTNRGGNKEPLTAQVRRLLVEIQQRYKNGMSPTQIIRDWRRNASGIASLLGITKEAAWGSRFPDANRIVREVTALEYGALQWKHAVQCVSTFLDTTSPKAWHELRYESLVTHPEQEFNLIIDFLGKNLPWLHDARSGAQHIKPGTLTWRDELNQDELFVIYKHISALLRQLGYADNVISQKSRQS